MQEFMLSAAPWIAALLGVGGVGYVVKAVLDHLRGKRKQTDDMASHVVGVAMGRLKSVERHAIICDANLAYYRHKASNLSSTVDSALMMFEVAPEKLSDIIARLKEKRARDEEAEALERAAILAAAVASVSDEDAPPDMGKHSQPPVI